MSHYPDKCRICSQTLYYFPDSHNGEHPGGLEECIAALASAIEASDG